MGSNDFVTLFFLVAAVLIFLQLRSVLGRRTGNEKPPFDPYSPRDLAKGPGSDDGKVVTLPKRDEAGGDDKILCIPAGDPRKYHIREIEDVSEFDRLEIQHFFETYKDLEPGKSVEGAHWAGRETANKVILEAIQRATDQGVSTSRWPSPSHS